MIRTVKGKVATTQFQDQAVKTTYVGTGEIKLGVIENRNTLAKLTVVLDTEDGRFKAGDIVYVPSRQYTAGWATAVMKIDDKEFILVPDTVIECFRRPIDAGDTVSSSRSRFHDEGEF